FFSSVSICPYSLSLFFFIAPAPPDISPLSLHDALPISAPPGRRSGRWRFPPRAGRRSAGAAAGWPASCRSSAAPSRTAATPPARSEEHTSELQSLTNLVCRLLLEKKKTITQPTTIYDTS